MCQCPCVVSNLPAGKNLCSGVGIPSPKMCCDPALLMKNIAYVQCIQSGKGDVRIKRAPIISKSFQPSLENMEILS